MDMTGTSRRQGFLRTVCASVFAGVFAPVLVSVIVEELHAVRLNVLQEPHATAAALIQANGPRDIFVSHGLGATLADARRDAVRQALLQAAFQLLDQPCSDTVVEAVCAGILTDPSLIVLRCENVRGQRSGGTAATRYECDVVVELARQPLRDRLRSARLQLKEG
jgi:hypothetical protein